MPSRRDVLGGAALAAAGAAGAHGSVDRPIPAPEPGATDWPMARYDPAGTGYNPAASGPREPPTERWRTELDGNTAGPAPPALVGDALYVSRRGGFAAIDRSTGAVLFDRDGYSYLSSPTRVQTSAYRADALVVEGREGIYGLDGRGGYAVHGRTLGLERWHAPGPEPPIETSTVPSVGSLVASAGTVYGLVSGPHRVFALDANAGRIRWSRSLGDVHEFGPGEPVRPALWNHTVYVASWPDRVAALDTADGSVHWTVSIDRAADPDGDDLVHPPAATDAGLIVPSRRAVTLLDPTDGGRRWQYVHGGDATAGSVAVADGAVVVADGDEALHAIDLATGDQLWTAPYRPEASPIVADGVVYVAYSGLPELVAFDAATGERRWTYETPHGVSQPIVGDGVLYLVSHEGVVALAEGS